MHTKFECLLSKSLTTLEVMTYYLVVHTGPGPVVLKDFLGHVQLPNRPRHSDAARLFSALCVGSLCQGIAQFFVVVYCRLCDMDLWCAIGNAADSD